MFKSLRKELSGIKYTVKNVLSGKERTMVYYIWLGTFFSNIAAVLYPLIDKYIVDGVVSIFEGPVRYSMLVIGITGLLLLSVYNYFYNRNFLTYSNFVSDTVGNRIHESIFSKFTRIKYKYYEKSDVFNQLSNVKNNVPRIIANNVIDGIVPELISAFIGMCYIFFTLSFIDFRIAILILLGNVFSVYFKYRQMKENYYMKYEQIPQKRWASTYWNILTSRGSLKEVRIYNLFDYLFSKWKSNTKKTKQQAFKLTLKYSAILIITQAVSITFKMLAFGIAVYAGFSGKITLGTIVLVYSSLGLLDNYFRRFTYSYIQICEDVIYIDNYIDFMNFENENTGKEQISDKQDFRLEFSNVSFRYPETEKYVIKDISLKIEPGEKIAIVGKNGSGKSTFVSLINGFYDSYEGQIFVNGHELKNCIKDVRKNIRTVFQDFHTYAVSLKDNILFGDVENEYDDRQIMDAAEKADAAEFINNYSNGIYTHIGNLVDDAVNLSGGEKQKLVLARTFLNPDIKLIILDEPTASLDPRSESVIYKRFLEKIGTQTAIMISHRLGATRFADRILVFDDGKIVEDGTHMELMERRQIYYELYTAQAGMYAG